MRTIYLILFVCFLSGFTTAQTDKSTAQKLDDYFTNLANGREFNGNVLVAENGKVVYEKSFGYADFEARKLNTKDTEFELASIAKPFTATAVLQLKEKGKLNLDDKFIKYFPEFPYAEITVRHLLAHTSGLPDLDLFDKLVAENPDRIFENKEVIPVMKAAKTPLRFQPGEKWSYNNFNYALLALLVEKLSGQKFDDYLKKNVFEPARMTRTYVRTSLINAQPTPNLAFNYTYPFLFSSELINVEKTFSNPFYKKTFYNHAFVGMSYVYSTTGDMLKFDRALYDAKLLKNETLEEAFTPTKLNSGEMNKPASRPGSLGFGGLGNSFNALGWFILEDAAAGKIVWHGGGMPGILTIFLRNVTKKQTVIVFDNTMSPGLYRKGLSAMNILNGKPILTVKKSLAGIYGRTLIAKGVDSAAVRLNELKADTENYSLSEDEFNNMAYDMMFNGFKEQALETFKINTFSFPTSDNVYESYGDALLRAGKKEEAIIMFKKALKVNPDNKYAKKNLIKAESEK
ncbi:MAG TPA: serine hydrolase [Pyrinomonadaceae bacterium]|jgi:CubicO group peptidase (beta-lactamase class C family)